MIHVREITLNRSRSASASLADDWNPIQQRPRHIAWMGSISVVVWLVALPTPAADWQSGEGYRFKSVSPEEGSSRLTLMGAAETGLLFTNQLSEDRALESSLRTNGSGVAAGDVDGENRVAGAVGDEDRR